MKKLLLIALILTPFLASSQEVGPIVKPLQPSHRFQKPLESDSMSPLLRIRRWQDSTGLILPGNGLIAIGKGSLGSIYSHPQDGMAVIVPDPLLNAPMPVVRRKSLDPMPVQNPPKIRLKKK